MIIDILLDFIYVFLWVPVHLIALLPDVTVDSAFASAFETAGHYLAPFNSFLPIHELFDVFTLLVVYVITPYFTFKILNWAIRKIPGVS
jgi:hypothetical protein